MSLRTKGLVIHILPFLSLSFSYLLLHEKISIQRFSFSKSDHLKLHLCSFKLQPVMQSCLSFVEGVW